MKKFTSTQKKAIFGISMLSIGLCTCLILSACGGSASENLNTGVFIDSAVEGLDFQSGNRFGATDAEGRFYYKDNEAVAFSVGGLPIGNVSSPKSLVTPIDLVDEPNSFVTHPTVTNICRFLQSLDQDGNPDNGILISKNIRDEIQLLVDQGLEIAFDLTPDAFTSQTGIQTLFAQLNAADVFTDGVPRALTSAPDANSHFFRSLAAQNATPVVMINLGDGLTNGAQSGSKNVNQYTQIAGCSAYISYQMNNASDLVWNNPLLELLDADRNFTRVLTDDAVAIPSNLGVAGATTQSMLNEKTGTGNTLLDELLKPIPENNGAEVSQMEAALYLANLYPNRLKLFTLWIGAEDSLGAATRNGGTELTQASLVSYLDDAAAGHDLNTVEANLTQIVDQLHSVEYGYVFIATLPHVQSLGAFFGKADIETLATFEGAAVTALGENEMIGFDPFVGDPSQVETSVSRALETDNVTLNAAISQTILQDANVLNQTEINLINDRVDAINAHIRSLADAFDNVFLVDTGAYYDQMAAEGIQLETKTLTKTFDQGFFSLDGYYPSHSGYALLANEFITEINNAEIGMDISGIDVNTSVLPVDPYNVDTDGDGFVVGPGMISVLPTVPIYDPALGGWIDCNDNNNAIFPEFVSGNPCS